MNYDNAILFVEHSLDDYAEEIIAQSVLMKPRAGLMGLEQLLKRYEDVKITLKETLDQIAQSGDELDGMIRGVSEKPRRSFRNDGISCSVG